MRTTTKKGTLINLDEVTREYLRGLAEKNSSSMSQEVRRLILNERDRREANDTEQLHINVSKK